MWARMVCRMTFDKWIRADSMTTPSPIFQGLNFTITLPSIVGINMKAEQLRKLSEDARAWADSEQGKRALKKAVDDARKTASKLEEARRVNPDDLHRHFTL